MFFCVNRNSLLRRGIQTPRIVMNIPSAEQSGATQSGDDSHPAAASGPQEEYDIEVFYDGECPFCRREIAMLKVLDRHHRIRATDIAASDFDRASLGTAVSV